MGHGEQSVSIKISHFIQKLRIKLFVLPIWVILVLLLLKSTQIVEIGRIITELWFNFFEMICCEQKKKNNNNNKNRNRNKTIAIWHFLCFGNAKYHW